MIKEINNFMVKLNIGLVIAIIVTVVYKSI